MHESETRALKRATILLLLISLVRWGWSSRPVAPSTEGDDVLPALLSASRDAADAEARRSTPLGDGERLDPNRADEIELDRLPGVGPSTAGAIVSAREAGQAFRRPDDLLAVRGIGPARLERIRPHLDLSDAPPATGIRTPGGDSPPAGPERSLRVDPNRADIEELQRLPGIGPAIAERILVARREQLFASADDLARVSGIGSVTVERLRPWVTFGGGP